MTVRTDEPRRPIEERLETALRDTAMGNVADTAVPPGIAEAEIAPIPAHRGWRMAAAALAAAAVAGIAFGVAGATGGADQAVPPATGPAPHTPTERPTSVPSPVDGGVGVVVVGEFCDNFVPRGCTGYRNGPLWPFTSYTEAESWRARHRTERGTAWQYDAEQVGNRYLHRVLGLGGLSVLSYPGYPIHGREPASVMAVDVGYYVNGQPHAAGGLQLARFGHGRSYPWEVVGPGRSVPPHFAITAPASARNAADPVQVSGGHAPAGALVQLAAVTSTGTVAGRATATAEHSGRWSTSLEWNAPSGMLALVATSGGTATRPEHFALLGVRAG